MQIIINSGLIFNNLIDGNNTPKSLVIHHIEAVSATVEDIHSWHKDGNGWAGIGYHYYIRKDGSIYKGRPDTAMGAHCQGFNQNSLGIAFEGNYEIETSMSGKQLNSWYILREYLFKKYGNMPIYGHREVGSSLCPGQYFPLEVVKNGKAEVNKNEGYVVTNYLPMAWEGYNGIDLEYILRYFNCHRCYMLHDNNGMWIETQTLPISECNKLRETLGSWFCKIV